MTKTFLSAALVLPFGGIGGLGGCDDQWLAFWGCLSGNGSECTDLGSLLDGADGDLVGLDADKCPALQGPARNNGCPLTPRGEPREPTGEPIGPSAHASAKGRRVDLRLSGSVSHADSVKVGKRRAVTRGLVVTGSFRDGPRAGSSPLGPGSWRVRFNIVADLKRHRSRERGWGVLSSVTLRGAACVKFSARQKLARGGKLRDRGSFTIVGGSGDAGRLRGGGRYSLRVGGQGELALSGRMRRPRQARTSLPKPCVALLTAPVVVR